MGILENKIKQMENKEEMVKMMEEMMEEMKHQKEMSLVKFLELFLKILDGQTEIVKSNQNIAELLQQIVNKKYPKTEIPPYPEFPKKITITNPVYEVAISKPDWWKDAKFDTSSLEKKLEQNNQFLGSILLSLQNLPDIEKEKEGIITHISGLIGTRRNVSKLVRNKPETPRGTIDGSNKDFYTQREPFGGFIVLVLNGVQQKKDDDFTLTGAKISYTIAPPIGSNHQVIYF